MADWPIRGRHEAMGDQWAHRSQAAQRWLDGRRWRGGAASAGPSTEAGHKGWPSQPAWCRARRRPRYRPTASVLRILYVRAGETGGTRSVLAPPPPINHRGPRGRPNGGSSCQRSPGRPTPTGRPATSAAGGPRVGVPADRWKPADSLRRWSADSGRSRGQHDQEGWRRRCRALSPRKPRQKYATACRNAPTCPPPTLPPSPPLPR